MRARRLLLPAILTASFLIIASTAIAVGAAGIARFPGRSEAAPSTIASSSGALFSEEPGTISGVVDDSGGNPIADAWVFASPSDVPISPPMPPTQGAGAYSGADGSYTIDGVAPGEYVVGVFVQGYVDEYYDDVRDPDEAVLVSVTAGNDTSGIDFALDLGGKISGVVTDAGDIPLEDVLITANPTGELVYTSSDSPPPRPQPGGYEWAYTDANGAYTISGLLTGDYLLEAEATGYLDEYYNGARWQDDATPVFVVEGQTTPNINFSLNLGGSISGAVTDADGNPLEDCEVDAQSWDDGDSWGYDYTDEDGLYILTRLANGHYRVYVSCEGYYVQSYPDPVPVVEGQVTSGIDFSLDEVEPTPTPTPIGSVSPTPTATRTRTPTPTRSPTATATPYSGSPLVRTGSTTLAPGASGAVALDALGMPSPGLGAFIVDVTYDPAVVTPINCAGNPDGKLDSGTCNTGYDPDTVRCVGYSSTGAEGDLSLCDITFQAVGASGTQSTLSPSIDELADTSAQPITAATEGGTVTVGVLGDASGDGRASMVDAMLIAQCVAGLIDCENIDGPMADVNCNGNATMVDAMLIAQYVAGLITEFQCF